MGAVCQQDSEGAGTRYLGDRLESTKRTLHQCLSRLGEHPGSGCRPHPISPQPARTNKAEKIKHSEIKQPHMALSSYISLV